MIYYKITNQDSQAYKRHQKFAEQHREENERLCELIDELGLPDKFYIHRGSVIGFPPPKDGNEIPSGMHINSNDRLTPDKRTAEGKKIHKRLKDVQFPTSKHYMENIFGVSIRAITGGHTMTTGCMGKGVDEGAIVKIHPKILSKAKEKEEFSMPDGLEEITGSEYHELAA